MLGRLVEAGIEYLFVSNSDNLGATLDVDLLAYFAESGKAFLMEARTPALILAGLNGETARCSRCFFACLLRTTLRTCTKIIHAAKLAQHALLRTE